MKTVNEAFGEFAKKLEAMADTHKKSSMFFLYNAAEECHLMNVADKARVLLRVMERVTVRLCYERTLRDCAVMAREIAAGGGIVDMSDPLPEPVIGADMSAGAAEGAGTGSETCEPY
jgi:hypothetical protein